MRRILGLLGVVLALAPVVASGQTEPSDRLRVAKVLFFDNKYAEAREQWLQIKRAGGPDAELAAYYVARCSERLGERSRALAEYAEYLGKRPSDAALVEEARTSRVALATRLFEEGQRQHLPIVIESLKDPAKTVRYFAAFQLASLGPAVGQPAVPVLKRIIAEERDEDLVERAKIKLLNLDPDALAGLSRTRTPSVPAGRAATWIRVRITERGKSEPKVSVNLPLALADLVFKSLPEDALKDLRLKGYKAENFWEKLKQMGPTDIIEIVGDEGERIKIWIE
jgi:hypothetical protein